ncbi:Protein RMD5 -like protein A, partial [Trichinella sp. T8]
MHKIYMFYQNSVVKFSMSKKEDTNALEIVESTIKRLQTGFENFTENSRSSIDALAKQSETLRRELLSDEEPDNSLSIAGVMIFERYVKKVRDVLKALCSEHREMHGTVSKCGREIDKHFVSDISELNFTKVSYEVNAVLKPTVDLLIAKHYLTLGMVDVADLLLELTGSQFSDVKGNMFANMTAILDQLKVRNVTPALNWARNNKSRLDEIDSCLEFSLLRLQYVELLRKGGDDKQEALEFSRVFQHFSCRHSAEVQSLMACLIFTQPALATSTYKHFFSDDNWDEVQEMFVKDWCKVYKIPTSNPLGIILEAGTRAVPALLHLNKVMKSGQVMEFFGQVDELPIEVDLNGLPQYHSVFSCPILRQQTSEVNPPVRLVCGHVISKEAMNRLVLHERLKCPYCPQESTVAKTRILRF